MKRIHAPVPLSVVISTVAGMTAIWLVDLPMLALLVIAVIAYGLSAVAASFIVSQEGTQPHPCHKETEADARDFVIAVVFFTLFKAQKATPRGAAFWRRPGGGKGVPRPVTLS